MEEPVRFMVTCGLDYGVTTFNLAAERIFGIPCDDAIGRPMPELICAREFSSACHAIVLEVRNSRMAWEGEMLARRANGVLIQTNVKISTIEDDRGKVVGLMAIGREKESKEEIEQSPRVEFARYLVGECNLTPSTAFTYEQGLLRLEKYLGKDVSEITAEDIRRFLRMATYHPATKSSTLVAMKAFHKWGALEGMWQANGILALRAPKWIQNPLPSLTCEEARALLDACRRPNELRLCYFGLYEGTRVTESASIGYAEWVGDKLRFEGKGRKVREVPVHPEVELRKAEILETTTTRGTLKHTARSLSHYTGIPFTSHTLRRTWAVRASELGSEREVIGAILGHAPVSTTDAFYAPVRWGEKVKTIQRHHYRDGPEEAGGFQTGQS